jgi:hypothetical protein
MSDSKNNLSYEELLDENLILQKKLKELTERNAVLEDKIYSIRHAVAYEICEFYNECRSLKKTAEAFCYDNIVECGNALVNFNDCSDFIQDAKDYKEYHILEYGEDIDEEN